MCKQIQITRTKTTCYSNSDRKSFRICLTVLGRSFCLAIVKITKGIHHLRDTKYTDYLIHKEFFYVQMLKVSHI